MKKTPMDAFNVVKMSDEGVKVPLSLPDGTPTDEYLTIRGADSKDFKTARAKADRAKMEAAKKHKDDPVAFDAAVEDINRTLVASLVSGWSFDEPCNATNAEKLFRDAPQIQQQVDRFAADRANFFTKPPAN